VAPPIGADTYLFPEKNENTKIETEVKKKKAMN
jgi:hypothetical protein